MTPIPNYMQSVAGLGGSAAWPAQSGPYVTRPTASYERSASSAFGVDAPPEKRGVSNKTVAIAGSVVFCLAVFFYFRKR